jgi:Domain of unknown function (DUF5666)
MSGLKDGNRRTRLLFGAAAVIVLVAVVFAVAKSRASSNTPPSNTIARAMDHSLAPRKYQFVGQGQLQGGSGDSLLIGNLPVVVNAQTQFAGSVHPGEMVSLSGSILANQSWLVDRIEPVSSSETYFIFAGPLESASAAVWKVGGISIRVNQDTAIDSGLNPQEMLLVTFSVQADGTWLASKIGSLQNNQGVIPPTQTPTPTSTAIAPVVPVVPALKPVSPPKPKPKDPGKGPGKGPGKDDKKGPGKGGGKDHKK